MASEMKEGEDEDLDGLLLFMQRARRRLRGDDNGLIHKSNIAHESAAYGPPALREWLDVSFALCV